MQTAQQILVHISPQCQRTRCNLHPSHLGRRKPQRCVTAIGNLTEPASLSSITLKQRSSRLERLWKMTIIFMPSMSAARNESLVMLLANLRTRIRQYKSRISKWNLDKNIKPKEMKAIVRKKLERKLLEPDRPEYSFRIRGVEVDSSKIDRWIHAHGVSESTPYSTSSRACTFYYP
jgi:hypothetical protein